jgi:V8-like Glu-specific endopeptidase
VVHTLLLLYFTSLGTAIHPEGGTAGLDTRLVLHAGCGEQRLAFAFRQISTVADPRAQASGIPSPIDGIPIEPSFNLGFGDDNRIAMRSNAYPWSAVGRVQIDGRGHCTGALIARDLVLTNAHCIFVDGQRRGVTFAPNYRNGQAPETVRGTFYSWGTAEPKENRRADWAIIHLERPIGDRYGWFSSQALNYPELRGRTVTYVGYSTFGDETVEEFRDGETAQVHIGCQVRDVYPDQGVIHTDCDNGQGGSGGPIFIWQNNQPIIVAINAAEVRGRSQVSFFTQNYTPGQGNIGVPTLAFGTAIREASYRTNSGRFKPGFYSRVGMNPPGIIYFWPSPWDGGRTDVWCNVPNHSMYARNLNNIGSAMQVSNLAAVQNTAKYWSQACSDDVFRHSRVQN